MWTIKIDTIRLAQLTKTLPRINLLTEFSQSCGINVHLNSTPMLPNTKAAAKNDRPIDRSLLGVSLSIYADMQKKTKLKTSNTNPNLSILCCF